MTFEKQWTANDLQKLFKIKDASKTPIYYAEAHNEIPQAQRVPRGKEGKIKVRKWSMEHLPAIGSKFGFLPKPTKQLVICMYTPKGGVIKTTLSANTARILAVNGIKVIVCGLDFQRSLTRYLLPVPQKSLDELATNNVLGLHHFLFEKASIEEVIQHTDLPTLDIIPETSDLNFMAKKMRVENRREYIFKEKLLPALSNYDVVIFDCNPGWSDLAENALVAANTVLMPIACETECYEALQSNMNEITEFQESMQLEWDHYWMIPTLLENNSTSQNIYARYLNMYEEAIIPIPIRRYIMAQEARMARMSIIEYDPKSPLASDYYDLLNELWNKLGYSKESAQLEANYG